MLRACHVANPHFFSLLCPRGSSHVFSPLWFYIDGIRNPTRVFLCFPTPFLVPTVLCTRPYRHQPVCIPLPKRLPWLLVLMIISALSCLDKYLLFAKTLHLAARCSMVSSLLWHTLQYTSWTYPLAAFQDLVSTICFSIIMIEDVFLPCKLRLNQRWHSSASSWKNWLCCSFVLKCSILLDSIAFCKQVFFFCHVGFHFLSSLITSLSSLIDFPSKCNLTPTSSIVFTDCTMVAFSSLIASLFHPASIHWVINLAI